MPVEGFAEAFNGGEGVLCRLKRGSHGCASCWNEAQGMCRVSFGDGSPEDGVSEDAARSVRFLSRTMAMPGVNPKR
jgi:hypothetical protein